MIKTWRSVAVEALVGVLLVGAVYTVVVVVQLLSQGLWIGWL